MEKIILAFLLGILSTIIADKIIHHPKIKVVCSHALAGYKSKDTMHVFNIKAINKGRVPITLSGVGMELEGNMDLHIMESDIIPIELPKEVLPGENYQILKNYKTLKEDIKKNIGNKQVKRAFFRDQTGRKYYSKNINAFFK